MKQSIDANQPSGGVHNKKDKSDNTEKDAFDLLHFTGQDLTAAQRERAQEDFKVLFEGVPPHQDGEQEGFYGHSQNRIYDQKQFMAVNFIKIIKSV